MTSIVLNQIPRFPAHVSATNGLTAIVENGVDVLIVPSYGDLVPVPAVTKPATTFFMAWDAEIDYYQSISFDQLAENLSERVLGQTLTAQIDLVMAANQAIYFTSPTVAAAYDLSAFVRGISGSADSSAFRAAIGLGNVNNTSDANKPISTAQQDALNLKANAADVYTKTVTYTKTEVDGKITQGTTQGPQLQGFTAGLGMTTNVTDAANDIDIAIGAAASDVSPYYLIQLAVALTKRIDASWVVGNNQGGLDTGTVSASGVYYIWLIQRSDTLVSDVLFSLSASAPTMPAAYDRKRLIGSLMRDSSSNGPPAPTPRSVVSVRNPALTPNGSAFTIAGVPPATQAIRIKLGGLSLSATTQLVMKLGTNSGIVSTGYFGRSVGFQGAAMNGVSSTSFFSLHDAAIAPSPIYGQLELRRAAPGSNRWTVFGSAGRGTGGMAVFQGGVDLGAELTQVQLTTAEGTSTLSGANSVSMELEF